MAVVSHTINSSLKNGILMSLGILIADYIFVAIALTGLSSIASQLTTFTFVLTYVGASYLIFLAYQSWYSTKNMKTSSDEQTIKLSNSSLMTGIIIGLSNPKAILFYIAFFPAFVEISAITSADLLLILTIVTIAISGVFMSYALIGAKANKWFKNKKAQIALNRFSSLILLSCACLLIYRV